MSWLAGLRARLAWARLMEHQHKRVMYVNDKRPRKYIMQECKRGTPECAGRVRD